MSDYGHDLLFGTFVTPVSRPASRPVQLAIASEKAGLDLVSFQDHPYQPSFLDTSTLLTYAASQTDRIALSANVASSPLRSALGLARSSATLDVLSHGRFRLGIGAGAFWDGIQAMGGRRLTPGQGVSALAETIGLIRASWDAGSTGPIEHEGTHLSVTGALRGPFPAHPVPIWVGAYKPRMLALTGALSDGWLPSIEYIQGGMRGLEDSNARIDDAAADAGRDPSSVRRLMNFMRVDMTPAGHGLLDGPPRVWVQQIADLAIEHGISAFIIAGDNPRMIEQFGAEVAPAVRELVATVRSTRDGTLVTAARTSVGSDERALWP